MTTAPQGRHDARPTSRPRTRSTFRPASLPPSRDPPLRPASWVQLSSPLDYRFPTPGSSSPLFPFSPPRELSPWGDTPSPSGLPRVSFPPQLPPRSTDSMAAAAMPSNAPETSAPPQERRELPPHLRPPPASEPGDGKAESSSVSRRLGPPTGASSPARTRTASISSAGGAGSGRNRPSRKQQAKELTQKDEENGDLKASLVDGRLPEHLRHPIAAWEVMHRAAAPQGIPPGPSLFQEAQWFLAQEWDSEWIIDNTGVPNKNRWSMAVLTRDRILRLAQGLQEAVHEMCKLEERGSPWLFDPNGRLFKILEGASAKHFIYDDFLVLRERVRKAVEMLHYRTRLHTGSTPSYAPSSTASVLYVPATADDPRRLLDLHLSKPQLNKELTDHYREQVAVRLEDEHAADQSHRLGPGDRSVPNPKREELAEEMARIFRPVTPPSFHASTPLEPAVRPARIASSPVQRPKSRERLSRPTRSPTRVPAANLVPSASRAFPVHLGYAARVQEAVHPSRKGPPISAYRGDPFSRPSGLPQDRASPYPRREKDRPNSEERRPRPPSLSRGRRPSAPHEDPGNDPDPSSGDDGSDYLPGNRRPRRGRSRDRRPSGRRRDDAPPPSPSPERGAPVADADPKDTLVGALHYFFPHGVPKLAVSDPREARVDLKYDRNSVPKWDGSSKTLVRFIHEMNYLASLNPRMSHDLAVLAPQRFTGFAKDWWLIQEPHYQQLLQHDWKSMLEGIRAQFFTHKFLDDLRDEYDQQKFRQKGYEKETPSEFVVRRLLLHRYLPMGVMTEKQEIAAVIRRAPSLWRTVLNIDSVETIAALLQQVQDKAEDLVCITSLGRATNEPAPEGRLRELPSWNRRPRPQERRAHAVGADALSELNLSPDRSLSENLAAIEAASLGLPVEGEPDEDLFIAPLVASAQLKAGPLPGANRRRPPEGYSFPRNDSVVSRKPPPSPCKVCGSEKHWDRECPHWEDFLVSRAKRALAAEKDVSPEEDRDYALAYVNYVASKNDQILSASSASATVAELGSETTDPRQRHVRIDDEPETNPQSNPLPPESPFVLMSVTEEELNDSPTARLYAMLDEALGSADRQEREQSIRDPELPLPRRSAASAAATTQGEVASPEPNSSLPPTVRVVQVPTSRKHAPGRSSVGISALSIPVRLMSTDASEVTARVDSGADISLVSSEYLESIPCESRPRLQRGLRMKLFQLTNGFHIDGFVRLPLYSEADNGDWLRMEVECYVVPNMTTPLLLGEDFQVNYELGVTRRAASSSSLIVPTTGHTITASSSSSPSPRQFAIFGRGAESNFVRAKSHRRNQFRRRKARRSASDVVAVAATDVTIRPHCCRRVLLSNVLPEGPSWVVEKTVLGQADGSYLLTTPTIVDSSHLWVAVANPSDRPRRVCRGESLGPMHLANEWFQASDATLEAHASSVASLLQEQMASPGGSPAPPDKDDESWGPKTAEAPDPATYPSELLEDILDIGPEWPPEERLRLLQVLRERKLAFAFDGRLGHNATEVEIKVLDGARPVSLPMYAASPAKREVIDKQHDAWLALEVIEPSLSPWAAPVLIAYRNGKPRFCVDYRRLNAVTVPDEFPIPRQTEILQALSGAQVLSSLDALSGFTQLTVAEADREKTAFRTHRGLFQFRRLPFGLRNGPSAFQRVMQGVLAPYLWIFSLVYIDDIVIYSRSWQEHVGHVDKVLEAIIKAGITLSPPKCHFGYSSILLLGQKVSRLGFSTHEEKVRAVDEFARPSRVSELQSFLGMAVYFSNYIPYYSFLASPLFQLLRKGAPWDWTAECEHAWTAVKAALREAPVLAHAQPGQAYRLYTDASDVALGACLQQVQLTKVGDLRGTKAYDRLARCFAAGEAPPRLVTRISSKTDDIAPEHEGGWGPSLDETWVPVERVIAYWSRTCKPAERNYSATEREALAAKEGLVHFLPFIEGERIILITDHTALQWARTFENANRRLAAWGAVFSAFAPHLEIVHRAGRVHSNVDPLSRIPRSPPHHDSPRVDSSDPIKPDQARMASVETDAGKLPAARMAGAAALLLSWADVLENAPSFAFAPLSEEEEVTERSPLVSAYPVNTRLQTRRRAADAARDSTTQTSTTEPRDRHSASPTDKDACYTLLTDLHNDEKCLFVEGYQSDPYFKDKWKKASAREAQPFYGQCFVTGEDLLLYLRVNDEAPKLCVPKARVPFVLSQVHDSPWDSAHEGARKFTQRLQRRFHWPTLRKDAEAYAHTCDVCQKIKTDRRARAGWLRPNPVPLYPHEWVSMDLITGLPNSDGFDAVFVVVCRLTKHALCIPCSSSLNTVEFARLFVNHVVLRYGLPSHIICDRDPRWTSEFWRAVASELGLHLSLSSAHHPQHDGQTEIVNQTIETMLRAFVRSERAEWSKWLPFVCHAYNTSIHSSTGYSPHFLLYGKEAAAELDILAGTTHSIPRPQGALDHAANFLHDMSYHRERAREAMASAQEQAARAYNQGRREEVFQPGDLVLVNPHSLELVDVRGTGKKLVQRMLGPFPVQEQINPLVYKLALPDTYPMNSVINIEHLRKYHEDASGAFADAPRPIIPDPRRSDIRATHEWEVDSIVGWRRNRRKGNRLEFLIRWKGFGPTEDSWASESDLRNAQEILRSFLQDQHSRLPGSPR